MKACLTRFLVTVVSMALGVGAFAQTPVWRYDAAETTYPSMARDANGNVYFITREGTFSQSFVKLTKLNASGVPQFTTVLCSQGTDHSYRLRTAVTDTARLYVLIEVTVSTPTSSTMSTKIMAAKLSDGSVEWQKDISWQTNDIVLSSGNVVTGGTTTGSVPSDRRAFINAYVGATGASAWAVNPSSNESGLEDLVTDGSGNVYAGGWEVTSGSSKMYCVSYTGAGGFRFATPSTVVAHASATGSYVAVDTSVDRVYVAGSGTYSSPPNDLDSLVVSFRASDGVKMNERTLDWSFGYDYAQGLAANGGRVFVASYGDTPITDHMTALSSSLSNAWVFDEAGAGGYYRYFGFDNGGNVFYAKTFETGSFPDSSDTLIVKLRATDGQVRWRGRWNAGNSDSPTRLIVTQAGEAIIAGNANYTDPNSVYIAKLAQAVLTTSQTSFPGGWSISGTITLGNPAMAPGATFTLSSSKVQATVPASVTLATSATSKSFTISTVPVATNTSVTLTAYWDNVQATTTITLLAPVVSNLVLSPASVRGGVNVSGTVQLTGKAPTGGTIVNLGSGAPLVASTPLKVTVPAGSTSAGFTVTTSPVLTDTSVNLHATTGSTSKTTSLQVTAPLLTNFTVAPASVTGGSGATLSLTLDGKAPAGYVVQLISGSPTFVTVPATATMTSGSATKNVAISTSPVTSTLSVTLIAFRGSIVRTTTLTLTP